MGLVRAASVFRDGVLASAALVVACSSTPPRSDEQVRADESIAAHVYAALNADPTYFYRHVDVRVDEGVTDLSGYVWSTDAIYRARQIARQVAGVKRVVTNNLELEREGLTRGHGR
jgi:osmotically-inducible protein OsmY